MRTCPVSEVSWKEMPAVNVQAFRWLTILARRSAGVLSMKLTVSIRGDGPQYRPVSSVSRSGAAIPKERPSGIRSGALTGLILIAVSAAFVCSRAGRDLIEQA